MSQQPSIPVTLAVLQITAQYLSYLYHQRFWRAWCTTNYLYFNSLIQFGFRPGSSTQEAILYTTHDWNTYLERGYCAASIFFDLSKAFDKVPHSGLLKPLSSAGVNGPLLKWFQSYRKQRANCPGARRNCHTGREIFR